MKNKSYFPKTFLVILFFIFLVPADAQPPNGIEHDSIDKITPSSKASHGKMREEQYNILLDRIRLKRSAKVIIQLESQNVSLVGKLGLSRSAAAKAQERGIKQRQDTFISKMNLQRGNKIKQFKQIPFLALDIDETLLEELLQSNEVLSISEDTLSRISLDASIPYIDADYVWSENHTGSNQAIAILDSGVDASHVFFTDPSTGSKVISEACYSTTFEPLNAISLCSDGSTLPGSGSNCTGFSGCNHGTHVAGIAAGNGNDFSGVAKDASLIAIQVFSGINDPDFCGSSTCIAAFTSDIIQGLERVYSLAMEGTYAIASVNLSLGGGGFSTVNECDADNQATKQIIDNLRSAGVATVIASGNESFSNKITSPACISSAISVGATNNLNKVASFSNSANWLTLLAPGVNITSSVPNDSFSNFSGTSMAAPHVAGAFALLKSKTPSATVEQLLAALVNTGRLITDSGNGLITPRIKLDSAADALEFSSLPANIILDNDFDGIQTQGQFKSVINTQSYNGRALEGVFSGLNTFRFTPTFPQSGNYRVYAWWPASSSNTNEAVITIKHDDGETQINVNQQMDGSQWIELGVFSFSTNNPAYVEISDSNGPTIIADAVRFEFLPLFIETNILPEGSTGVEYNYSLEASGGSLPFSWNIIAGNLPGGLSLQTDGTISGSPSQVETRNFTVQVTDNSGNKATQALSLSINSGAIASPNPTFEDDFESGELAPWNQFKSGSIQLINDPVDGWVLRKISNNDPNGGWAPLGSALNDFEFIVYTRKPNAVGGNAIRYSMTDGNGNGYGIRLNNPSGELSIEKRTAWSGSSIIANVSLPEGMVLDQWYTLRLSRQGDALSASAYFGRVDPAQASPVIELNTSNSIYNSFNQVNINGGHEFDTDNVRIFDLSLTPPVSVDTNTFTNGTVDTPYYANLVANGGTSPYTWIIIAGTLPDGLSMQSDGTISGSPSQVETSNFTVQVTDNSGNTATRALSLSINSGENPKPNPTFEDNFESGTLSPWNQLKSGSIQLVNDPIDNWFLRKISNNDPNGGWAPLGSILNDFEFIVHTRKPNAVGGNAIRYSLTDTNGNGYGIRLNNPSGELSIEKRTAWSGSSIIANVSLPEGMVLDQWYTLRLSRQGNTLSASVYVGRLDPAQATPVIELNTSNSVYSSFSQVNINGGHDFDTDNIRIFD